MRWLWNAHVHFMISYHGLQEVQNYSILHFFNTCNYFGSPFISSVLLHSYARLGRATQGVMSCNSVQNVFFIHLMLNTLCSVFLETRNGIFYEKNISSLNFYCVYSWMSYIYIYNMWKSVLHTEKGKKQVFFFISPPRESGFERGSCEGDVAPRKVT